jgi:hypothetical protein
MDTTGENTMKILIAVESCKFNRPLHQAMLDTWLGALSIMDVDCRFFIGGINEPENDLEVWVPCLDTYDNLAVKTRGICRWAQAQGYDFLFKCDTDTVVNPRRLLESRFENFDYMGGENLDILPSTLDIAFPECKGQEISFASGGAGYWLSQDAMTYVTKSRVVSSPAEDVYVSAVLGKEYISPVWHEGYRWRPNSKIEGATTFHLSSALQVKYQPKLMYEYYKKILDN